MYGKFYIYKQQVSYDAGETWEDTGSQTPSGTPIAEYSTLAECEGTCECSSFTYSTSSISAPSGGSTTLISYSGCSQLTIADDKDWITISGHSFSEDEGSFSAIVASNSSSARTGSITLSYNGNTCQTISVSQASGYTPPTCDCSNFVFAGTEEITPSHCYITFSVQNDTSSSQNVGTFELFHNDNISVQIPIDVTLSPQGSTAVTVDITGLVGNTIHKVEGVVNNVSHCYQFHCSPSTCDLDDGDSLLVKLSEQTTCS